MRRILAVLASNTMWSVLAALAGWHFGSHVGYSRGARDVAALVIELRSSQPPPEPFTQGGI